MYFQDIDEYFHQDSLQEIWHKQHPNEKSERYETMPFKIVNGEKVYVFDFTEEMILDDIMIFKETRYTPLYAHCHKYLELNYVYSGECEFLINDSKLVLKKGDCCILEPNVVHSAKQKEEKDIVINIVLKEKFYNANLLSYLSDQQIISTFLLDCFNKTRRHNNYLIFRNNNNQMIDMVIQSMCHIYYAQRDVSYYSMMEGYTRLMFMHLMNSAFDQSLSDFEHEENHLVLELLKKIQKEYASCQLKSIATELGYNYNYLSNLIKEKTGKTFSQIKQEQQMLAAKEMLQHTQLPVYEISLACGFHNLNFFYKKFNAYYQCLPKEFRTSLK